MKTTTVLVALAGGMLVTTACVPFLIAMTPPGPLRLMRIAFLAPVSILSFQACLAWTSVAGGARIWRPRLRAGDWARLACLCVVVAMLTETCIEPLLPKVFSDYAPPAAAAALLVSLPWTALFQPLFFVATPYAFGARLGRRLWIALAAVVVTQQGFLMLQIRGHAPLRWATVVVLITGLKALVLALSYRTYGLTGPILIALTTQLRHLLRFV